MLPAQRLINEMQALRQKLVKIQSKCKHPAQHQVTYADDEMYDTQCTQCLLAYKRGSEHEPT